MPWKECSKVDERGEFVRLAKVEGAKVSRLCERFGISRKTGHKWLRRFDSHEELADRSRRPQDSPRRTARKMEQAVLGIRDRHPAWGGRKIARRLRDQGFGQVPAPSTVTSILHRHGLITPEASYAAQPWQRFEHEAPNALWQIDFKGDFATASARCHPLTVLDDHSRYSLALQACPSVSTHSVQPHLQHVFERYGLPVRINPGQTVVTTIPSFKSSAPKPFDNPTKANLLALYGTK